MRATADRTRRWPPLVAWIVMAGAVAATLTMNGLWSANHAELQDARLATESNRIRSAIVSEIARHEDALRSVAGLFAARDEVSPGEFKRFVGNMRPETRYPGLAGVAFLRADEERAVVAMVGEVPAYPTALGTDEAAVTESFLALDRARNTGEPTISEPFILENDRIGVGTNVTGPTSLSMYLPVYRGGSTPRSLDARRRTLLGWVSAPFRLNQFLEKRLATTAAPVFVEVFDGSSTSAESRMAAWVDAPGEPGHSTTVGLVAIDRPWRLRISALPGLIDNSAGLTHALILGGGAALALLAFVLLWTLGRARDRALRLVDRATRTLRENEERFRSLASSSPVGIYEADEGGKRTYVNDRWLQISGQTLEQSLGDGWLGAIHPDDLDGVHSAWEEAVAETHSFQEEFRMRDPLGQVRWVHSQAVAVLDEQGRPTGFVGTTEDITERVEAHDALVHEATHDHLTGLPNRKLLVDRLEMAIARASRSGEPLAVMFLDLDHFKNVNDELGHDVGDQVLATFASRLRSAVRPSDTVARMGGDEFIVLCEDVRSEADVRAITQRIEASMAVPISLASGPLSVSASIGISMQRPGMRPIDPDRFLHDADAAMYKVKPRGRHGYAVA